MFVIINFRPILYSVCLINGPGGQDNSSELAYLHSEKLGGIHN